MQYTSKNNTHYARAGKQYIVLGNIDEHFKPNWTFGNPVHVYESGEPVRLIQRQGCGLQNIHSMAYLEYVNKMTIQIAWAPTNKI
jgi:hypothetical protein